MGAPAPKSFVRELTLQTTAGVTAGLFEICLLQPLDLAKTRLQLQSIETPKEHRYSNFKDVFRKILKQEGVRSLWKGVMPTIIIETPRRAVKFCSFEQYKKLFLFGSPTPTPLTFTLAGLCAGLTEALLVCPFEVIKINMQANRSKEHLRTYQVARAIYDKHGLGLNGLFKGLAPNLYRNGIFNVTFFGAYFSSTQYLPVYKEGYKTLVLKIVLGFTLGVIASSINMPFEVVKNRLQNLRNSTKYKTMFGTFKTLYHEEGIEAFFKGYIPKILRLGPGGAFLFVTYEYLYEYLKINFP